MPSFKRGIFAAILALLVASPCLAAIGTPVDIGKANSTTSTTAFSLTVSATTNTGQMIFVAGFPNAAPTAITQCQDSQGNSYAVLTGWTGAGIGKAFACYSANPAHALTSGVDTITITYNASTSGNNMNAAQVSGLDLSTPFDRVFGTIQTGSSNSVSPAAASGALAQASEILFGFTTLTNTTAGYTAGNGGTGFANINSTGVTSTTNFTFLDYLIVSSSSSANYSPSWTTARAWVAGGWAFKAASVATTVCQRSLLGVGC